MNYYKWVCASFIKSWRTVTEASVILDQIAPATGDETARALPLESNSVSRGNLMEKRVQPSAPSLRRSATFVDTFGRTPWTVFHGLFPENKRILEGIRDDSEMSSRVCTRRVRV